MGPPSRGRPACPWDTAVPPGEGPSTPGPGALAAAKVAVLGSSGSPRMASRAASSSPRPSWSRSRGSCAQGMTGQDPRVPQRGHSAPLLAGRGARGGGGKQGSGSSRNGLKPHLLLQGLKWGRTLEAASEPEFQLLPAPAPRTAGGSRPASPEAAGGPWRRGLHPKLRAEPHPQGLLRWFRHPGGPIWP